MTRLYFYIQEIFRVYFVILHEFAHLMMTLIITFFATDIYVTRFHVELGKIKKTENGYHTESSSGYIRINYNNKRTNGKCFWLFLIDISPLLFTPLWLYIFYTIHIYIFIIGILYLPTLLPSRSDCNYIYNYLGYKLLLWH
jgi:hypothetical protein